jgi:predicted ArsR family transcriptional regulator
VHRDDVSAVAVLDDQQRARLYAFVRKAPGPVTREEAAAAVGISRKLAAFHLDRLVAAELLTASYDRPADATTRVGRTPKRYSPADVELAVTIPVRHYELVGEILLDAVTSAAHDESVSEAISRVSRDHGRQVGAKARSERRPGRIGPERGLAIVAELLVEHGFEPAATPDGLIQRNCPFHRFARRHPALVCGMNRDFVDGILDGLGARRLCATLDPADGRCCVIVTADRPL